MFMGSQPTENYEWLQDRMKRTTEDKEMCEEQREGVHGQKPTEGVVGVAYFHFKRSTTSMGDQGQQWKKRQKT